MSEGGSGLRSSEEHHTVGSTQIQQKNEESERGLDREGMKRTEEPHMTLPWGEEDDQRSRERKREFDETLTLTLDRSLRSIP